MSLLSKHSNRTKLFRAAIPHLGTIYFVEQELRLLSPASTPLVSLIERIWNQFPAQALKMLRNRILLDYPPDRLERATLKVTAKRFEVIDANRLSALLATSDSVQLQELNTPKKAEIQLDASILSRSNSLLEWVSWVRTYPYTGSARPILATLLDPQGQLRGAQVNSSDQNRLHHAEINLCREYQHTCSGHFGDRVPATWIWLVSLKPCRMCAEWIRAHSAAGANAKVYYLDPDPGRLAQHQILNLLLPTSQLV